MTVNLNQSKKFSLRAILMVVALLFSSGILSQINAQVRVQNSLKFGIMFFSSYDTALIIENKDTAKKAINSDALTGSIIFFEKILENYFGYEARYGLFSQDLAMKIDGISSNITNTANLAGGSMRAYAQSHRRNGVNFYGAVNVGLLNSNLKFTRAPPGTLQGREYNFTTYAIGAEAGLDYLIRFAGMRAAVGYQYGSSSVVNDNSSAYTLRYDLGSPYLVVGVFSFF